MALKDDVYTKIAAGLTLPAEIATALSETLPNVKGSWGTWF